MASGLQSWVEDHSNITMLNLIAYPIFSPWYWLHPHPPQKQQPQQKNQGQSISIAISFRRAQLSVIYSTIQKWKAKLSCFKMDQRWGKCIPPTTLVWYYTKWKYKHPHCCQPPPPSNRVLCRPHTHVWVRVVIWQYRFWPCLFFFLQ